LASPKKRWLSTLLNPFAKANMVNKEWAVLKFCCCTKCGEAVLRKFTVVPEPAEEGVLVKYVKLPVAS
jgi:hypothetical protein